MLYQREKPSKSKIDLDATSLRPSDKPVRKVITPSKQTIRTAYPSDKSKKSNDCESGLESRVAACLELSPGIVKWKPQPFTIQLIVEREVKKYTPDFHITLKSGRIKIIEAKPLKRCLEEPVRSKLIAAHHHFMSAGVTFAVVTEKDIGTEIFNQNLNLLRYYSRVECKRSEIAFASNLVERFGHLTISDLENAGIAKPSIYSLLANAVLNTELNSPLNPTSIITLLKENDNEKCLFHSRSALDFE